MPERPAGAGGVLALGYGFFTLASGSRGAVQLISHFDRAPVAYVLSGVAAVTYGVNTVVVARTDHDHGGRLAAGLFVVELIGVLAVGIASLVRTDWFPDASVWSGFGSGYGFVPLALPLLGLLWLRKRGGSAGRPVGERHNVGHGH
jgi:hypothetical protein